MHDKNQSPNVSFRLVWGHNLSKNHKKDQIFRIFFIIFVDILSFGMIIPLSPVLARSFGANGIEVGAIISLYSLTQFFLAPFWGTLSDKLGRKPCLLIGIAGLMLAHILLAFADSLFDVFFSRLVAGFFGGNLAIATACLADLSDKHNRSRNMSLIGMAFGLGFTLGPALGFLGILLGGNLGSTPPFGVSFASLLAAGISFINLIFTWFFYKESRQSQSPLTSLSQFKKRKTFLRVSPAEILKNFKEPVLGLVLCTSFLLWFALAQIEPTLILLVQDDFAWDKKQAYLGFAYIGLLMSLSQGFVRKLLPILGERQLAKYGLLICASGLLFISLSGNLLMLALGVTLFSVGYSLAHTSLSGALSLLKSSEEQGSIFGVNQSLSSFARILGPLTGGFFYKEFYHEAPFVFSACLAMFAAGLVFKLKDSFPNLALKKRIENQPEELYSIDTSQLSHLINKKITFQFFSLDPIDARTSSLISHFAKKPVFKSQASIEADLASLEVASPIVLICSTGTSSKNFAEHIRKKGYFNTYYVERGFSQLSSLKIES